MFGLLRMVFGKKRVKNAALLDHHSKEHRMQNAQFVSFLQQSGFRKQQLSAHDKTRRLKKLVAVGFAWLAVGGFLWVALESAHALASL